jgi:predicted nucleic acid-binding protein
MAAVARYLIDKSALARGGNPIVADVLDPLLEAGLLAICGVVELEMLYSARNAQDHQQMRFELECGFEWLPTNDQDFRRAAEIQGLLAAKATHRAVSLADLLIAAVAERHKVAVLHYDADFDLVAQHTTQPTHWIVPRGSLA